MAWSRVRFVVALVATAVFGVGLAYGLSQIDALRERADQGRADRADLRATVTAQGVVLTRQQRALEQANRRLVRAGEQPVPEPETDVPFVPLPGVDGADGSDGSDGSVGPRGVRGPRGQTGLRGPAGADGVDGEVGTPGSVGATGPAGPAGPVGPTGPPGPQGSAGERGPAGPAGADGAPGPTCPDGYAPRERTVLTIEAPLGEPVVLCVPVTEEAP